VKAIVALALLAVLGLSVAGCGGTKTDDVGQRLIRLRDSLTLRVSDRHVTIPNVRTGTRVLCKGWEGKAVVVPRRGRAVDVGQSVIVLPGTKPSEAHGSEQLSLTHYRNGSLAVNCTPSK